MLRKCFIIIFCIFFCLFSAICEKVNPDRIDEISRVYLTKDKVDGYVFFEGFDFAGYKPEPLGIKIMLDRTYEILKTEYGNKRGSDGKPQPFVFVGHSQGGLRALAMSTYLRKKDPVLYKQLKGVITLSGIDRGLKLLEGNGAVFRAKLSDSV